MSSSRFFDRIAAAVLVCAIVFTAVFLYLSQDKAVVEAMSSVTGMPYEELFDKFQVMEVEIEISDEDWADILENPLAEEYKQCDVTINGTVYTDAAIRTKGNTSLSQVAASDSDRYSFKIEFDHYDKNKSMDGLDKLVLNNIFSDATYVKEYIAYDIFNYIGVETPYYAFADITVNGENFGCYLALEAMEDSFLERVYDGSGQLYKPESTQAGGGMKPSGALEGNGEPFEVPDGNMELFEEPEGNREPAVALDNDRKFFEMSEGDIGPENMEFPGGDSGDFGRDFPGGAGRGFGRDSSGGGSDLVYTDDETESYSDIFDNASFDPNDEDKMRVIKALKKLSEGEELEKYVNVDDCLRYFAAQTFIVNMDSYYSNLKHNYYLYENNGQLTILPWDLNLAFGGFQNSDATEAVNSAIDTPMGGSLEQERPLYSKLMEIPEYQELYHSYLQESVDGYVNSGQFTSTLSKIKSVIAPYVDKDTTAFYSFSEFEEGIKTLETFVLLRAESVEKQLSGEIPADSAKRNQDTQLVDASAISLSTMGMQGGDGAGGKGSMNGNMFGGGPMGQGRGGHGGGAFGAENERPEKDEMKQSQKAGN